MARPVLRAPAGQIVGAMSVYDAKPRFQALLRPLCGRLAAAGVTANQVTLSASGLCVIHGAALALAPNSRWLLLLLPLTLFVRMALNAIDGMLAREHGQKSPLGAILNECGDVVSDAALYLPLALVPGLSPVAAILIVVLSGLTELVGLASQSIGAGRRYDGPMGKSDRALALGVLAMLLGLGWIPGAAAQACQWVILGLLAWTIVNRARRALAERQ